MSCAATRLLRMLSFTLAFVTRSRTCLWDATSRVDGRGSRRHCPTVHGSGRRSPIAALEALGFQHRQIGCSSNCELQRLKRLCTHEGGTEAMVLVNDPERIGFTHGQFPRATTVMEKDVYLLTSPMNRGICKLEINGQFIREIEVRPGMMRVIAPGEQTRMTCEGSLRTCVVSIPGNVFRQIVASQEGRRSLQSTSHIPPVIRPSTQVKQLFTTLMRAEKLDPNQRSLFVDGLTHALMACLLDNLSRDRYGQEQLPPMHLSQIEMKLCTEFARSMVNLPMDLRSWAGVLGMSTSSFTRRFKATTGKAPYTWFLDLRIGRAKDLLENSRRSLAQVCLDVGFSSQSHFTEAFRRRVGATPSRWRSEHFKGRPTMDQRRLAEALRPERTPDDSV